MKAVREEFEERLRVAEREKVHVIEKYEGKLAGRGGQRVVVLPTGRVDVPCTRVYMRATHAITKGSADLVNTMAEKEVAYKDIQQEVAVIKDFRVGGL